MHGPIFSGLTAYASDAPLRICRIVGISTLAESMNALPLHASTSGGDVSAFPLTACV